MLHNPPPQPLYHPTHHKSKPSVAKYSSAANPHHHVGSSHAIDNYIHDKTTGIKFYKGKLLGKGGFAKCYQVTESGSSAPYAAKQIDKISLRKQKTKEKLSTEIKIHSSLNNEFVCKFERYFEDSNYVYILLELCQCRSMMDLLRRKKRLSETETKYLMKQLLLGIDYMHRNRVIHRDLKLGNLFLDCDDKDGSLIVKIGDFGLAAQLDYDGQRKKTICGTPNYIAPEILTGGSAGHSYEVDVWSFGVILYTCLIGKPPFETMHVKTTYRKIKANKYTFPMDKCISSDAKDLITKILITEATSRPTVQDILNHPFFTQDAHSYEICPRSLIEYSERVSGRKFSGVPSAALYARRPATVDADLRKADHMGRARYGAGLGNLLPGKENHYGAHSARSPPKARRADELLMKHDYYNAPQQHRAPLGELNYNKKPSAAAAPQTSEPAGPLKPVRAAGQNEMNIMHENITKSFAGSPVVDANDAHLKGPSIWVSEYSDFSAKYGLAYRFNNGIVGAFYNDCTKMLWHPVTNEVIYITRGSSKTTERDVYTIDDYPESIKKKIVLIKYFKASFDKKKKFSSDMITSQRLVDQSQDIFVKMWVKTSHAYVFRLSNRVVQVSFNDHSELILSSEAKLITYTNRHGEKNTHTLSAVSSSYSDAGLSKRLKYAKDVLFSLISKRKTSH